jgi:hypothetical protein
MISLRDEAVDLLEELARSKKPVALKDLARNTKQRPKPVKPKRLIGCLPTPTLNKPNRRVVSMMRKKEQRWPQEL